MKKLYIAGPMTGLPLYNFPEFFRVEALLRGAGFETVNPARIGRTEDTWEQNMRRGIRAMLECDGVALLCGWTQSQGARVEYRIAVEVGIPAHDWDIWPLLEENERRREANSDEQAHSRGL